MEQLERILEAHGGARRWRDAHSVMARVSMGGVGFASRLQANPLREVELTVRAAWPTVTMADWPRPGQMAVCEPNRARIEAEDGRVLADRSAPGATLRSLSHWLWWDDLDVLYYTANILWQTVCLPFTLVREGCSAEALAPVDTPEGRLHPLAIAYPADIPVLRTDQVLYADVTGLLQRVDYSPRFASPWMRASQVFTVTENVSGFTLATSHRIYPCLPGGRMFGMGPLGWIDLDDVNVVWNQ